MQAILPKLHEYRKNALELPWSAPARNLYLSTIDAIIAVITSDSLEELRQACRSLNFELIEIDWQRNVKTYDNCAFGVSVSVLSVLEWLIKRKEHNDIEQESSVILEKMRACLWNAIELKDQRPLEPAATLFQWTCDSLITVITSDADPQALRRQSRRLGFELSEYVARAEYDREKSNDLSRQVATGICEAVKCLIDYLAEQGCGDEERVGENKKAVPVSAEDDLDLADVSDLESSEEIVTHIGTTHESKPPLLVLPVSPGTIDIAQPKKRASDESEREAGGSPKRSKIHTTSAAEADTATSQSGSPAGSVEEPVSRAPMAPIDPDLAVPTTTAPEVPSPTVIPHAVPSPATVASTTQSSTSPIPTTVPDSTISPEASVATPTAADSTAPVASTATVLTPPALAATAIPILRLSLVGQPPSISVAAAAALAQPSATITTTPKRPQMSQSSPKTPSPQKQPRIDSVFEPISRPRAVRLRIRQFEKLCTPDITSGKRELPNTFVDKAIEIQNLTRKLSINESEIEAITAELAKMCGYTVPMLQLRIEKERPSSSGTSNPCSAAQAAAASQFLSKPLTEQRQQQPAAQTSPPINNHNATARAPAKPQPTTEVPLVASSADASRTPLPNPTTPSAAASPAAPFTSPVAASPWKEAKQSFRRYLVNDQGDNFSKVLELPGILNPIAQYKRTLAKKCPLLGDDAFLCMDFKDSAPMAFAFQVFVELGKCELNDKPLHFLAYLEYVVRNFFGVNGRIDRLVRHFACIEKYKESMERIRNLPEFLALCQAITEREGQLRERVRCILTARARLPTTVTQPPEVSAHQPPSRHADQARDKESAAPCTNKSTFSPDVVDHEETVAAENSDQEEENEREDPSAWSKAFKCVRCDKIFLRMILFKKHLEKEHATRPDDGKPDYNDCRVKRRHKCGICGRAYISIQHLVIHKRCHTGKYPQKCFSCGTGYNTRKELERHLKHHKMGTIRPRGSLLCPHWGCTLRFKTRKVLRQHRMRCKHGRARATQQNLPAATFTPSARPVVPVNSPPNVSIAIGVATSVNPVQTPTNPTPAAAASSTLTAERPFKCECGMSFRTRNYLTIHKKRHSDKFEHLCEKCNTGYYTRNELERHKISHDRGTARGAVRVRCPNCRSRFKTQRALEIHQTKEHSAGATAKSATTTAAATTNAVDPAVPSTSAQSANSSTEQTKGESDRLRETENIPPEMLTDDDLMYMEQ